MSGEAATPDTTECSRFLLLWMGITDTDHVTLVAIVPDGRTYTTTFERRYLESAERWIAARQSDGANIYFEPNHTRPGCARKPTKMDIVAAHCRFADIDPDDEHHQLADERDRLIRLAEHLSRDPVMAPTAIIDSGNGIQPLWAVTREPLDKAVISRAEAETRDIEAALGAGGTHNVDRLLRLPGTVNFPNAAKQRRGRVVCRARLIFSAPNLYRPDEAAALATKLTALLGGTGLVRPKGVKATAKKAPNDADEASLMKAMEEASADKVTQPDHLTSDLRSRLHRTIAGKPRLADRWAGNTEDLVQAGRDATRSGVDLSLAAMLKAAGFAHLEVALILCAFGHGKANNDKWSDPRARLRHVARCVLRSHEPSPSGVAAIVEEFNQKYMVVNEAGKVLVYAPATDRVLQRRRYDRITFDDLGRLYMNRLVQVGIGRDGSPMFRDAASVWLEHPHRRQYLKGVTFDPSGRSEPGTLNLWQGFAVAPVQGDWSLMKEHIWEVICNKDEVRYQYLIRWLACMVQYPAEQGEVAVVLIGGEGAGKGTVAKAMLKIFGQHGMAISNARHLVGNFNSHLRDCGLLFADEAFYAGDKQHVSVLKSLITEPHLTIEGKYQNAIQTPNFLHLIMASNEDWVVPAALDARRFFVLVVSEHRKGDHEYFAAIWKQMEAGGYEAMLHDLLNVDLSDFNVRVVPVTDGLQEQKKLSLPTIEAWWLDVLHRSYVYRSRHGLEEYFGEWHDEVATEVLYASYTDYAQQHRERHPLSREQFGKKLVTFGAQSTRPRDMVVGEHIIDVQNDAGGSTRKAALIRRPRPPAYRLGSLREARTAFVEATGLEIDWPDSGEDAEEVEGFGASKSFRTTTREPKWQFKL